MALAQRQLAIDAEVQAALGVRRHMVCASQRAALELAETQRRSQVDTAQQKVWHSIKDCAAADREHQLALAAAAAARAGRPRPQSVFKSARVAPSEALEQRRQQVLGKHRGSVFSRPFSAAEAPLSGQKAGAVQRNGPARPASCMPVLTRTTADAVEVVPGPLQSPSSGRSATKHRLPPPSPSPQPKSVPVTTAPPARPGRAPGGRPSWAWRCAPCGRRWRTW